MSELLEALEDLMKSFEVAEDKWTLGDQLTLAKRYARAEKIVRRVKSKSSADYLGLAHDLLVAIEPPLGTRHFARNKDKLAKILIAYWSGESEEPNV